MSCNVKHLLRLVRVFLGYHPCKTLILLHETLPLFCILLLWKALHLGNFIWNFVRHILQDLCFKKNHTYSVWCYISCYFTTYTYRRIHCSKNDCVLVWANMEFMELACWLCRHSSRGTDKNNKNPSWQILCVSQDSNRAPSKSKLLPFDPTCSGWQWENKYFLPKFLTIHMFWFFHTIYTIQSCHKLKIFTLCLSVFCITCFGSKHVHEPKSSSLFWSAFSSDSH